MQIIDWIRRLFPPAAVLWALALPLAAAAGQVPGSTPGRLASGAVYAAGAVVCHQRPERSFQWGARAWPVCARCTGIYAGGALAVLPALGRRRRRSRGAAPVDSVDKTPASGSRHVRDVVLLAMIPAGLTLVWEWTVGVPPSNVLRALSGLPIGAVVAWIVMQPPRRDAQSG